MSDIKINNDVFSTMETSIQLSTGKLCSIYILLDVSKYPDYYKKLISLYENTQTFNIDTNKIRAIGCVIKTVDIDFGRTMGLNVRCSEIITDITMVRRDEIITSILK